MSNTNSVNKSITPRYKRIYRHIMDLFPHIRRKSLGDTSRGTSVQEKKCHYTIKKKLGSGSNGCVYLATNNLDRFQYAMKRIELSNIRHRDDYRRLCHEINILTFNNCPYLLHALDIIYMKKQYTVDIVSELFIGGNLDNYIYKYRVMGEDKSIPSLIIWNIFLQILIGLDFLHRNGIVHRDLKPANILLDHKEKPTRIAICDFGASICLGSNLRSCHTRIGTPYFMSPEQYNSASYNQQTDVWSLGCILYELITLEKPFLASNIAMLNYRISKAQYKPINTDTNGYKNEDILLWRHLIKKMIEKDVSKRISVGAILQMSAIRTKMKDLGLRYNIATGTSFEIPLILQDREVISPGQLATYIRDTKKEIISKLALKQKDRNEYQPSPIRLIDGRPKSDSSLLATNKLFIPIQNVSDISTEHSSAFRKIIKPATNEHSSIKKPYAVRLKNIIEDNRKFDAEVAGEQNQKDTH